MSEPLNELKGWLDGKSPIERGRDDFDYLMEHGTARQKEALLIVLAGAGISPSKTGRERMERASQYLIAAWSDQ